MHKTLLALLFSLSAVASDKDWAQKVDTDMKKAISKSGISSEQLGIFVGDQTHKTIFNLNGERKMIPASISKLITAALTLHHFPPGTKFKTHLLSDARIESKTLKGDLYLRGGGDPSFVSENMWFLVNAFLRNDIKVVEGSIVVDDSLFDQMRFDSSRQKTRVDRAYDAPTGAMSFNWNSVNVFVRPGAKAGDPATITLDPENEYVQLKGNVKTIATGEKNKISVERNGDSSAKRDVIEVSGQIAAGAPEQVVYKNITHPDLWSGFNLKAFLKQRGIEVKGSVKAGTTPSGAKVLAESESKPIEQIVVDMNKFSNNYVAEMLAKDVATKKSTPGTIATSSTMAKDYLLEIGLEPAEFDFSNPSGLTRDNKITAKGMWKVLQNVEDQFSVHPEFVISLPIMGVDGTLKSRMKNSSVERQVRAKTGFLTGVVSLAGYAGRRDGTRLQFVMMFNGSADEGKVRGLFDSLAAILVQ